MQKKWRMIAVTAVLCSLICFGLIGWYYWSELQAQKEYEKLQEELQQAESLVEEEPAYSLEEIQSAEFTGIIEVDTPAPKIPEGVLQEAEANPIDFERLQELNPELYAWIRIPGTVIDYPIAQHQSEDQSFYLHHDMYQNPRFSGCIYTENRNQMDFSDPVTVIYGHNMKNGTMFQNLHNFRDSSFFEEHKYIYIYTSERILVYEIFAAYPYDSRHILKTYDFTDSKVLEEYLADCRNPRTMEAHVREEVMVSADTPIITLSTCIGGQPKQRYLVQAVLAYEE